MMKKMTIRYLILILIFVAPHWLGAQSTEVTVSGTVLDKESNEALPFVNVVLRYSNDSSFVTGTVSNDEGLFSLEKIKPGDYILQLSFVGYSPKYQSLYVGNTSPFLDLGKISISQNTQELTEVVVSGKQDDVSGKMDKKTYEVDDNISQQGGSVLQTMQNLPGVTIEDGKVLLRGNANVIILIDGKQSALTGFGNQSGLENIPASAIDRIEIINNPSAKYDANGSAGIINIILKKEEQKGFNGKIGLTGGLGALWIKKQNLPTIRDQYQFTPKINPSLSINYRKKDINLFLQADYLYTQTLNKNEFVTRTYDDGTVIQQQTMRNRNTGFLTSKIGFDWNINDKNTFTLFGLYGSEDIIDNGDEPFFNADLSERTRLWRFLEDELKTTVVGSATYLHKFKQAGHQLSFNTNYTFHRENEQYYFQNIFPTYTGLDTFKLISDEQVLDFSADYTKPLKFGKLEGGLKFRDRIIPTNMLFIPGLNSQIDSAAGGWADYKEIIPALYGNYVFQNKKFDAEVGLRMEYVQVNYLVNPDHPTYKSDGYDYIQPFPNVRFGLRLNDNNKLSIAYNRRVNRPNEVDIRIFPKYDDAEIVKVGNPALQPQFTNKAELGYKLNIEKGYFYAALYGQMTDATITRIAATVPGNTIIYNVFQNAGKSYNAGFEVAFSKDLAKWFTLNLNGNAYYNQIDEFTVINKYPITDTITIALQSTYSGNGKMNAIFHLKKELDIQLTAIYLAPDIIPQGKIGTRFSLDLGIQKSIQKGKGLLFLNATDLLNTMVIKQEFTGDGFSYSSTNYYETQVVRFGYKYRF
ncbi:MAG: TonB-dependent receptor [Crocinitomicaceae bacterium]